LFKRKTVVEDGFEPDDTPPIAPVTHRKPGETRDRFLSKARQFKLQNIHLMEQCLTQIAKIREFNDKFD
jgi:hypothetical protein